MENGSQLDALDNVQMWYTATVVKREGDNVHISFDGFSERWDETLSIKSSRLAPYLSQAIGGKETMHDVKSSLQMQIQGELQGFAYFKAGYLMKRSITTFSKSWTRYYCVLYENYDFVFYVNEEADEEKGVFNLHHVIQLEQPSVLEFEFKSKDENWRFRVEDQNELLDWLNVIETCRTKIIEASAHHFNFRRDGSVIMTSRSSILPQIHMDEDDEKFNERMQMMHVNRHAQMTNVMGASPRSRSMTVQIPQGQVLLCGYLWKVGGYFKRGTGDGAYLKSRARSPTGRTRAKM